MVSSVPDSNKLYTVIWFQVFLSNTNKSYTIMISSNLSYLNNPIQNQLFDVWMGPEQVLPVQHRVDQGLMAMNTSHLS